MSVKQKKKWLLRSLRVLSRHPSHSPIRRTKNAVMGHVLACVRFGSTTEWNNPDPSTGKVHELNSIESIKNSMNKLRMKTCFTEAKVKTAEWWTVNQLNNLEDVPFPLLAKLKFGSRGAGMKKFNSVEELDLFLASKSAEQLDRYIFEKYYNYTREYRLHVSELGCFYSCRKMLKSDTPEDEKWYRNDSNCVWYLPDNENFDKPVNWKDIESECVKALKSVGLDFGACDVRVQSATNNKGTKRKEPEFIIVEINSAPSFGDVTEEKYREELPKILKNKY